MVINFNPKYIPGDIVYNHKKEIIRITSSYLKGTKLFYYRDGECGWIREDAIKPIPLTPEILEKNGWKKNKDGYFNDSYHIRLCESSTNYVAYKVVNNSIVWLRAVENVSDLQHLLFGLGLNSEMEV
ncbi:MAG: hypothetical protein ACLR50_16190 [Segatella copri]|jgi:hypothetical protein